MDNDNGDLNRQKSLFEIRQEASLQEARPEDDQPGDPNPVGGLETESIGDSSDCSPGYLARQSAEAIARVRGALGQLRELLAPRPRSIESQSRDDDSAPPPAGD